MKTNKKSETKKWFVADGMTWESLLYQGVQENGTTLENGTLE